MTASETAALPAASPSVSPSAPSSSLRQTLIFGTGLGIAMGAKDLEVAVVRSRRAGAKVMAATTIRDFRSRPAAEWGTELLNFLRSAREKQLVATVLVPRDEVIVRVVNLPGVADKDIPGAIALQVETLHPWNDEEVAWAWVRAGQVRAGRDGVLVGLVRKAFLDSCETLFSEAGIGVAAVTFSSAAIHAALRVWSAAPASLLCSWASQTRTEVYGESEARPAYSAEFGLAPERALAYARAELRLPPDYPARSLAEALPKAIAAFQEYSPLAYAAAIAASAPLLVKVANLLPKERRASNARKQYLLPALLGSLVLVSLIVALVIFPAVERDSYLAGLNAEMRGLEGPALRAQTLDKQIVAARIRTAALDEFRRRPQADLDVLNELTRLLAPPVWTNSIEIFPDSVVIAGEAEQAAPLLKLLDSSPLFQNSEFALSVTHNAQTEQFRIKTMRRNRTGRVTP